MSCSTHQVKTDTFRSAEKYCDVKVQVQHQYFWCHRVILASASEYFDALLGGNFRERDAQEIVLHDDIDIETFEEVLRCVYNSHEYECNSTVSNIYKLLSASLYLKIHLLEKTCVSYIAKNVSSIRDHVQIFALAQSMEITELVDVVSDYLVKNFDLFYDDKLLLEFSFDDLSFLLNRWSQAELLFRYETLMFHFLIRWMCHAPIVRRKYFMEFIEAVDFKEVSSDYVTFMLRHVKNFADLPEKKQLLGKRKLDSALPSIPGNTDEDLRNRMLLKRTISEHFLGLEKSSVDCDAEIPASFHSSTFYKNALGLCVFVQYSVYQEMPERDHAKVFSSNKYYPNWIVSDKTNAWNDCIHRWTGPQASTNSLYCMEILKVGDNLENTTQRFCTYSSVDMTSASKVLASAPITLKRKEFDLCVIPHGNNIYLRDSQMADGGFRPEANDLFSAEELNQGFYNYNCELDKWFSAPPMKFKQFHPCLTADHNLIYSIGGWTQQERLKQCIAQAFDYRAGKWMKLPNHSDDLIFSPRDLKQACIFKKKVFLTDGLCIESFDTVAHKWEKINSPAQKHCSLVTNMLAYDDSSLLLFVDYGWSNELNESDYIIATYKPQSQDWHTSKSLDKAINEAISDEDNEYHVSYDIKDVITFKI